VHAAYPQAPLEDGAFFVSAYEKFLFQMEIFPYFYYSNVNAMAVKENAININAVLAKYERSYDSSISILLQAKKGLKPQAVFDFISISRFSNKVIEHLLNKTVKTLTAYKEQNTLLDSVLSEKLLKLFGLYSKGLTIFGTAEEFNKWMSEPAFGLGNQVPIGLLDTITGIDLVGEELTRIEYGDLA
jgi:putative toxin-antitoxin system antitoxin component (TIGR02293 family)